MCKIRVIFKAEDNRILKDDVYQFDKLEISPVDRPSYITCVTSDEKIYLNSYFINEEEKFEQVVADSKLRFTYGKQSGRISQVVTTYTRFHDTILFSYKFSLPENLNIRITNNIREYLKLYGCILTILESSTRYTEDDTINVNDLLKIAEETQDYRRTCSEHLNNDETIGK
jgi:hypothetical protein